ncbi:MAG: PEP-CTERM sorting domain-containing protein [Pirellula staleyi]
MSGFDFNLLAGVGNGSQGTFTGGSLIVLGSRTIDFTSTPGQAFATSASDATNPPITVGTTDVQLGSVVLSTAGLAVGSKFDITLSDLNFNDVVLGPIASTGAGVSFQITAAAVPEPTTLLLLLGTSGCAMVFRRWRARSPHQPAN